MGELFKVDSQKLIPDPAKIAFGPEWHEMEGDRDSWWRWSPQAGIVHLKTAAGGKGNLTFWLMAIRPESHVHLKVNGTDVFATDAGPDPLAVGPLKLLFKAGTNILELSSLSSPTTSESDPRPLNFMIKNLDFQAPRKSLGGLKLRLTTRKLSKSGLFYVPYYLDLVPELTGSGISPLNHYLLYGAWENKDPNPLFSSAYYLEKNRDVYLSGTNPLLHYIESGAAGGCDPHPFFSTRRYVEDYPDVKKAGMNPLFHYLRYGILEGRIRRTST